MMKYRARPRKVGLLAAFLAAVFTISPVSALPRKAAAPSCSALFAEVDPYVLGRSLWGALPGPDGLTRNSAQQGVYAVEGGAVTFQFSPLRDRLDIVESTPAGGAEAAKRGASSVSWVIRGGRGTLNLGASAWRGRSWIQVPGARPLDPVRGWPTVVVAKLLLLKQMGFLRASSQPMPLAPNETQHETLQAEASLERSELLEELDQTLGPLTSPAAWLRLNDDPDLLARRVMASHHHRYIQLMWQVLGLEVRSARGLIEVQESGPHRNNSVGDDSRTFPVTVKMTWELAPTTRRRSR